VEILYGIGFFAVVFGIAYARTYIRKRAIQAKAERDSATE